MKLIKTSIITCIIIILLYGIIWIIAGIINKDYPKSETEYEFIKQIEDVTPSILPNVSEDSQGKG